MFNKKILQTTALAIRGALIIKISGGTAQKSVAEQSLTATEIQSHRGRYYQHDHKRQSTCMSRLPF